MWGNTSPSHSTCMPQGQPASRLQEGSGWVSASVCRTGEALGLFTNLCQRMRAARAWRHWGERKERLGPWGEEESGLGRCQQRLSIRSLKSGSRNCAEPHSHPPETPPAPQASRHSGEQTWLGQRSPSLPAMSRAGTCGSSKAVVMGSTPEQTRRIRN